jgi:hypothetical protein
LPATVAGRSAALITSIVISRLLGKELFAEFSIIQSTMLAGHYICF